VSGGETCVHAPPQSMAPYAGRRSLPRRVRAGGHLVSDGQHGRSAELDRVEAAGKGVWFTPVWGRSPVSVVEAHALHSRCIAGGVSVRLYGVLLPERQAWTSDGQPRVVEVVKRRYCGRGESPWLAHAVRRCDSSADEWVYRDYDYLRLLEKNGSPAVASLSPDLSPLGARRVTASSYLDGRPHGWTADARAW
jgi:hypothetical protein